MSGANGRKPAATIRDVAEEAGVAIGTVSRVLNNSTHTSPEVRQLVAEAVARLEYHPSRRARSLRRARSMAIAAIVPELVNPVNIHFLRGVERTAQEREYVVLIGETHGSADQESRLVERLVEEGIDGVVLGGTLAQADRQLLRDSAIPVVPGDDPASLAYTVEWETAEARATEQMVTRLVDLGHRRVAMVSVRSPAWTTRWEYRRARGDVMRRVLRRAGGDPVRVPLAAANPAESCCERITELAGENHPPTAYVAMGHRVAPLMLLALKQACIRIPTDASIVSYGDSDWAAAYQPALSVVRHDTFAEAAWFTSQLLDFVEGVKNPIVLPVVAAEFVERESCQPPPPHQGHSRRKTRARERLNPSRA